MRGIVSSPALCSLSACVITGLCVGSYWAVRAAHKGSTRCAAGRRQANLKTLESFECREVLKNEDDGRVVTLLGRFAWQKEDEMALVKLTATPLSLEGLLINLGRLVLDLKSESGAEYAFYDCWMSPRKSLLRCLQASPRYTLEVIAPASEKVVNRHLPVTTVMWTETAQMYATVTEPYLEKVLANEKSLAWLYNVLAKEKEADRILYEDDDEEHGFLINVDTKWRTHPNVEAVPREQWRNHSSVADLYCLAICHKRGIRTLRDLSATHLPMLREIYARGVKTIEDVYGVPENQLRVFVHYMPQFFHFHVHFTRLENTIGVEAERAHLLTDIIQNVNLISDFYRTRTMQFRLRENDALHRALVAREV